MAESTPLMLDFFPLEDEQWTRISQFFKNLREGRLTTTRCDSDGSTHWPPRVMCPQCHGGKLSWVNLPSEGRLYAFSALNMGLPMGMEKDLGAVVGLVELDGAGLKIFSRISGAKYDELKIGDKVRLETFPLPDGRVFFRFSKL